MAERAKSKSVPPKPVVAKPSATTKLPKGSKLAKPAKEKTAKPAKGQVKAVKPAARAASHSTPPAVHVESFHVLLAPLPALIHSARPQSGAETVAFSSFDDAKDRAIDHLIELIEEAERRLHALRRAGSHAEFEH